ncbi:MAG: homoserine dehydrogenase [Caldithrix sp.]|nr:homoserine dehydrogenase [Caldithrix sp.]
MAKTKKIYFALLGFGKLGTGFYRVWQQKRESIKEETGFDLELKYILVKNINLKRKGDFDSSLLTDRFEDIAEDKNLKIAVDAIGGIEPTFSIVKHLMAKKIHLVSANRSMLASKMLELIKLANTQGLYVMPEPSLGGGVPIISALQRDLVANRIQSIIGILSGTSNYIISEMTKNNISLRDVLKYPAIQKMGESISIIDYEGTDAAQKVAILAAAAFGIKVDFLHLHAEGISDITPFDVTSARQFGYEFKLLAIIKNHEDKLEIRVHPTLIPINHPLTLVHGEYNAYFIETDLLGSYMLSGRGVGIEATSSIILRDIVAIADSLWKSARKDHYQISASTKTIMPMEEIHTSSYIRFPCLDKPGVIGEITTIFGYHDINIASAHAQVDPNSSDEIGYVHILVDRALEHDINSALKDVEQLNLLRGKIKYFRIL